MKISFTESCGKSPGALVVFVAKGAVLSPAASDLDGQTGGAIRRALSNSRFKGESGQSLEIMSPANIEANRLLMVGIGDAKSFGDRQAQDAGGRVYAKLASSGEKQITFMVDQMKGCPLEAPAIAAELGYGLLLRSYRFDKYFTKKEEAKKPSVNKVSVVTPKAREARSHFSPLEKIAEGVFFTRDLVSEPANVIHPESFAALCKELEDLGVKVTVLGEKEMEKLGMGALLGVGLGSRRESQMVIMDWNGLKTKPKSGPLALVGKGVTFDTGGISLKSPAGMELMKWDMGGAGAVAGAMKAIAGRKAKAHVVGVIGLVENMPDGQAQRPGDVVTSMSGQTIEVINTDAEGRLVLGDALHYVQDKYKPCGVIDLATLTGAMITALGHEYAGIFSNDDTLSAQLTQAGEGEDEKVWRFPLGEAYDKMINSDIADMKNVGQGGKAGSITAAQFLKRFVKDGTPWVHIDIAGMAWSDKVRPTVPKGGTGYGVRLLNRLVADHYEQT